MADDKKAEGLASMFPTLDKSIISATLAAHGGNEERAVSALLEMTDESFKAESHPAEDVVRSGP